jgi:phage terminase large subunit-like protein
LKQRVLNYAKDIQEGTIVSGVKTKWMVDRFHDDFSKIEDENYPYYIDWDDLLRVNRWASLFKHRKGVLAGKPIVLLDFQLFLLCNIFCFKRKDNGYKRFRETYIQLSRKNAKSQLLSIMTSYVAFLSDEAEECYITGYAKEQSNLVYEEVIGQIEAAPLLKGKYTTAYNKLRVFNNGSLVQPLSRESKKFGDGRNSSFVVVDEYHTHPDDDIVDVQRTGMMARANPQIVYITTAGFDINSPCKTYYDYATRIINPEDSTENDNIFVAIYEIDEGDDIKDESVWAKSNPLISTYPEGMNSLRADLKMALDQPEKMRSFLTKNMNLWIDSKEDGYIELSKWNKAMVDPSEKEAFMEGANVYLGIDLSMTTDLTAVGWVAVKNGKFMVGQHSFMPEGKYKERMSRDKVRFDIFKERNELTLTYGDVVDYNYVKKWVIDFASKYNVIQIGYDKWNATHFAQELLNDGYPMIEIPQSVTQLSEPTKRFRENVYSGTVVHLGDRLLKWSISNAVLKEDQQENVMIGKQVSKDRIDPVAAIINAFARAMYDDQVVDLNEHILSDDFSF